MTADGTPFNQERDFSSLFIDVGEGFTLDVARRYGHAHVERLLEKLRYFNVADQIDTIVNGDGWALPGQRERRGNASADVSARACLQVGAGDPGSLGE